MHNTPLFDPHITLIPHQFLTEQEVIEKAREIASLLKPFTVNLTKIGHNDAYFTALYIHAERSAELMNANKVAQNTIGMDEVYMPHLTLLYGDLPLEEKQKIIESIGDDFNITFPITSIYVYYTGGNPTGWHEVAEFTL